jgi:hypothetical protein
VERKDAKVLARYGQLRNVPRAATERVDPTTAAEWLERSRGNRRISQEHVTRLSDEMRSGRWQLTHQGIAFDSDGYLIDGHHTLWAVLLSGVTVDLMVTSNLRPETIRVIDTGKTRSLQDRLTLSGLWGTVSRAEAACLKRMVRGHARTMKRSSSDEYLDWKSNARHVRFAVSVTEGLGRGVRLAAVRAVVARAHRAIDAEVLHKFCWQTKNGPLIETLKGMSDRDTYDTAERALWAFVYDRPMASGEAF